MVTKDEQTELADLADEYWDTVLAASPRSATLLGDHRFDDRIDDITATAHEALRSRLDRLRSRVGAVDRVGLTPDEGVTQALLRAELDRDIDALAARHVELASDQMDGVHASLLTLAPQVSAPTPEIAGALAERHRQLGTLLDQAVDRFRAGLAAGRAPARLTIERSLRQLDNYLATAIDDDPFVTFAGPEGWAGEAGWRATLTDIARDVIRPAFARYRHVLAEELLPVARPDDRCGLSWLGTDGEELYAGFVRHHTTTDDLTVDEIHELGRAEIDRLAGEYAEIGTRLFGTGDQAVIFDRLRSDPALRYVTGDEILADARRCLDVAGAAMGGWFGRLPRAECVLEVVPDHLAADAPSAYYFPPPADGARPGTYVVNLAQPTERTRFDLASTAFHEGIPGHHLQLAIAGELDHLPRFQRYSWANTAFVEGWALYAERLADEMDLYRDDLDRIGLLANDSWRSARLVVDTGLHALGWSRQRAIDFMVANVPVALAEIEVEIDRYVAIPGQALGYKIGQLEIQRLRGEAETRAGGTFDIRAFHDALLGSGSVSLTVLRRLVSADGRSATDR
jgi:uncharacterized protein (DUF885 family)